MHLYLEIHTEETDGSRPRWVGMLRRGDQSTKPLGELALGPKASVEVKKGRSHTLEELMQALILRQREDMALAFDERGQLEIGRYLYEQTLVPRFTLFFALSAARSGQPRGA